jgi:oligoribonuclease NrnB/cAMP/cGMP phosphodiesterase (DHH superfamily)
MRSALEVRDIEVLGSWATSEKLADVSMRYPVDGHWKAAGHNVIAEEIFAWLSANLD